MKKCIHLFILAGLSVVSLVFRLQSAFFVRFDGSLFDSYQLDGKEEFIQVMKATFELSSSVVNKVFVLVFVALLAATLVFCFKKRLDLASYSYIAYLVATVIANTYNFFGTRQIAQIYTTPALRQGMEQTALFSYVFGLILFAIFLGLTLFFLYRKPTDKRKPVASSGIDI